MLKNPCIFVFGLYLGITQLTAQVVLNDNGRWHTIEYSGTYQDFRMPSSTTYSHIEFILIGGDGGFPDNDSSCSATGGQGAKVFADFEIGNNLGNTALPLGTKLRFVVGGKGENNTHEDGGGAGGGGGTALLDVTGPESNYRILAVAGGGGGGESAGTGFLGACYADDGLNASLTINGTTNNPDHMSPGINGNGGESVADLGGGGGGGGAFAGSTADDGVLYNISGRAGGWTGAQGGDAPTAFDIQAYSGGFGFGSGGGGFDNGGTGTYSLASGAGGGGGYSGGAAGSWGHAGGGGGSYVIPGIYGTYLEIPNTATLADGQIRYRFINRTDCNPEIASISINEPTDCSQPAQAVVNVSNDAGCDFSSGQYFFTLLKEGDDGFQILSNSGVFENLAQGNYQVNFNKYTLNLLRWDTLDSEHFTINAVGDIEPPNPVLQDITVYLDENGKVSVNTADLDNGSTDNCGIDRMHFAQEIDGITYTGPIINYNCDFLGVQTPAVFVYDYAGNGILASSHITVVDNLAPRPSNEIREVPESLDYTVEMDVGDSVTITEDYLDIKRFFQDNCTDQTDLAVVFPELDRILTCADVGTTITGIAKVKDESDNESFGIPITIKIVPAVIPVDIISLPIDEITGEAVLELNDIINSVTNLGCLTATDIANNYTIPMEYSVFGCHEVGTHTFSLNSLNPDFPEINVTVEVTQPNSGSSCVTDESYYFITTWEVSGNETNRTITIPTEGDGYNYSIDWGDGSSIENAVRGDVTHTYSASGTYTVKIIGDFPRIFFNETGDSRFKIKTIEQWGNIVWTSMAQAFEGCTQINVTATDIPNLSNVTSMQDMFKFCNNMIGTPEFNNWEVATITNMRGVFYACDAFNQYIGDWNVSNVTIMDSMFAFSDSYNQPMTNWNTGSLENTRWMFRKALGFNQDIGHWDVSNLKTTTLMLEGTPFDQDLGAWDISNFTSIGGMLKDVTLSQENYDSLLIGWSTLEPDESQIPINLSLNAGNSQYCIGLTARNTLTDDAGLNWNISDGGPNCDIAFETFWKTDNPGASANNQITIPVFNGETYNYNIDWGDGTSDLGVTGSITHTYTTAGNKLIRITGTFPRIYFNNGGDNLKIIEVLQWGSHPWTSMERAFAGCTNMEITAFDNPNLSEATSLQEMFSDCQNLSAPLSFNAWDVSTITNMKSMFRDTPQFNTALDNWNTSQVIDMNAMFEGSGFNQNISSWNVDNVEDMSAMFKNTVFNQDISNWIVSEVTDMSNMFENSSFNQVIPNWNVSAVTDMSGMFKDTSFNQDISDWTVSNVENMAAMFQNNTAFDQDIGKWDVASVTDATNMFLGGTLSFENYDSILLNWSQQTLQDNVNFNAGSSNFCLGETSKQSILDTFNWVITDGGKDCPLATVPNIVNLTQNEAEIALNAVPFELGTIELIFSETIPEGVIISQNPVANTDLNLGSEVDVVMSNGSFPLIITGVMSGDYLSGTQTNALELYVSKDIPDLSVYGIGIVFGGGSDGPEFYLSGTASAGDFIYITNNHIDFQNFFGFAADFEVPETGMHINGGSAVELFADQANNTILIDTFGDINTTGFSESWGYANAWAYRKSNTGPESIFVEANWRTLPYRVFLSESGITTNSMAPVPFPLGTYGQAYDMTPPVANCQNISREIGDSCLNILASDINNSSTDDTGIALLLIKEATSQFADDTLNLCCADVGTNLVELVVFDAAGNMDTCSATIDVTLVETQVVCKDVTVSLDLNGEATVNVRDAIASFEGPCFGSEGSSFYFSTSPPAVSNGSSEFSGELTTDSPKDDLVGVNNPEDEFYYQTDTFTPTSDGNYAPNFTLSTNDEESLFVIISSAPIMPNSGNVSDRTGFMDAFVYEAPGNYVGSFSGDDDVYLEAGTTYYIQFLTQDPPLSYIGSINQGSVTNETASTYNFTMSDLGDNTLYVVGTDPSGFVSYCQTTVTVNPLNPFVTTWKTDNLGTSDDFTIEIPTTGSGYNYQVDWGDGTVETGLTANATHTYANKGTYTVSIHGDFPRIFFNNEGDALKLLSIENWGNITWQSMASAFQGCANLNITNATIDTPDLSQTTSLESMFEFCDNFNADINNWDVSHVEVFDKMFSFCSSFNQSLDAWVMDNAKSISYMFLEASAFNQNINSWNVSNVIDMNSMFNGATSFNQDINSWDVSNVSSMRSMFEFATAFDGDITNWNVDNVEDMSHMFDGATSFNQDIGEWNTGKVANMSNMFSSAVAFDQNLENWNISALTDATAMFGFGSDAITLSSTYYDAMLTNWSKDESGFLDDGIDDVPINVVFGGGNSTYCLGAGSRNGLINKGWTITDGGLVCSFDNAFTLVVNTENPGVTANNKIQLRAFGSRVVDWGDGSVGSEFTHTYATPGIYTIKVIGEFFMEHDNFGDPTDALKLIEIQQWGDVKWTKMSSAFFGCANLQITATDIPDLSQVTNMGGAFSGCTSLGNTDTFNNWDVSTVVSMHIMFSRSSFNGDISNWNVSNLEDSGGMFQNATNFNQDLSSWDISKLDETYDMLKNTNLSVENYDKILIGWSIDTSGLDGDGIDDIPANRFLGTISAQYCNGADARSQLINTYGWTFSDEGLDPDCPTDILVSPKVYLQGAYINPYFGEEHLMRDDMRISGLIAETAPYADGRTIDATILDISGNNAIVDWVLVELRDATNPTVIVDSQSALLQRDGDVVSVDGISSLAFNSASGNYFIAIKHRNHLGIMSASSITLSSTTTTVDFSDGSAVTFGTNAQTTIGMPSGVLGMWSGDVDGDGAVSFTNDGNNILFNVLFHPNNVSFSSLFTEADGYLEGDIDLNGNTSFQTDLNSVLFNVLFHPENSSLSSLFSFSEQLPMPNTTGARSIDQDAILNRRAYIERKLEDLQQQIQKQ